MCAQIVEFQDLVKAFPGPSGEEVLAVQGVSLVIKPGEMVTLLGPSGCGKTTTLRMLAGFETPSSGRILIGDKDVTYISPNNRDTAMVFQSYALFPHMTVRENIAYGLRFRNESKAKAAERVERIMDLVGLKGLGKRPPGQMSGGQQQRVALARALVVEPSVLLFDEPLSNLDAKLREQMREEIRRVQKRLGITALYVTHDQSEAMALSDRIVVMNKGRIEQEGTPQEIYRRPISRFVADFIGKVNFIKATVTAVDAQGVTVRLFDQNIELEASPASPGSAVTLVVRPESMSIASEGHIPAEVTKVVYLGAMVEYELKLPDGEVVTIVESDPVPQRMYKVADSVWIKLIPESVHLLKED